MQSILKFTTLLTGIGTLLLVGILVWVRHAPFDDQFIVYTGLAADNGNFQLPILALYQIPSEGTQPTQLTFPNKIAYLRSITQIENGWIYFNQGAGGTNLFRVRLDGTHLQQVTHLPDKGIHLGFSSNNLWVVTANSGFPSQLYRVRPNGSFLHRFAILPGNQIFQAFSPDREWIYFTSGETTYDLWRVHTNTGELEQLTFGINIKNEVLLSSDGQWIYFCYNAYGPFESSLGCNLAKVRADGSDFDPLTSGWNIGFISDISPDGQWLIYHRVENGNMYWRMAFNITTHEQVELLNNGQPIGWFNNTWLLLRDVWDWTGGDYSLVAVNPATQTDLLLIEDDGSPFPNSVFNMLLVDGRWLSYPYFTDGAGCPDCISVGLYDIERGITIPLVESESRWYRWFWSPDMQWFYFVLAEQIQANLPVYHLYRTRPGSSILEHLAIIEAGFRGPQWATWPNLRWSPFWITGMGIGLCGISVGIRRRA